METKMAHTEHSDERAVVVGAQIARSTNKKAPVFFQSFFAPFSYILFLWYSPILKLVSHQNTHFTLNITNVYACVDQLSSGCLFEIYPYCRATDER